VSAAHARSVELRRLVLVGRLDEAEWALEILDPTPRPLAARAAHELVVAGIAIRRLQTKAAQRALDRARQAAHEAGMPVLKAEV
ncbi:helix-turn-helix domain-containing protein, partial [Rhizobium leguminosarum]